MAHFTYGPVELHLVGFAGERPDPAVVRALMELVALDGLSVTEAAAVLGVKPGTARVRLHRSRARVQSHHLVQEVHP